MFTASYIAVRSSRVLVLDLCSFLACSMAFFIFVQLHNVFFALNIYVVMRCCLVVLCVDSGFFVASQFIPWLFSFLLDYTTSSLVLVFTASCIGAWLSHMSDLDSLLLLNLFCDFLYLIT